MYSVETGFHYTSMDSNVPNTYVFPWKIPKDHIYLDIAQLPIHILSLTSCWDECSKMLYNS